jgi:hypothetical protein
MCTNAIDDLVVMNTSCGYIGSGATTLTAQNVITAYDVIRASAGTVTNCVMNIQTGYGAGSNNNNYDGDVTYTDCEFNYSSAVVEDWPSIFYATGPCSLTITHSIFIGGESNTLPVLDSFQSSDTIDFANNIYDTNAAFVVASRFTDDGSESLFLSLAQWQALGYDTGSVAPSAATESAYTDVDIGAPATPGMTLYDSDNGEWADIAGGAGIGGESDQFNFAYTPISGSATLLSDVIMQAGLESATAGVMFRDSTAADGAFADAVVTQDQSVEFQWRSSDGAAVQSVTVGGISGAVELEVVRNGNSFSAYYSEGNGWTEIGTAESVSMPTTALLGMAVSGGNNSVAGAAIFSNTGWDFGPPVVASFQVNDGSVQRAMVDSLTVTFNEPVTLASNALTIEQLSTTGGSPTSMSFSQTTSNDITWVLTFTDASYIGGSLPDGKYDLIVSSSAVTDAGGQPISGTNPTFAFSRLYGDFGGQGVVNAQDFTILSANFGAILSPSLWYLDFYGQGTVNGSDFMEFSQRFGTILPTVSAEGVAAMPASADAVAVSATTSSPAPALLAQPDLHVMPKALPAAQPPSPGNDSPDWFDLLKKDADRIPSILREAPADL